MNATELPDDLAAAHAMLRKQAVALEKQSVALEMKDRLIEEQAHGVLQMKADRDQLDRKVGDLRLTVEKLLQQLYGRRSERRTDGEGQLYLQLGEEPTPEVVSALEAAVEEARSVVEEAEEQKKQRRRKRPARGDRKFPEHLPRYERIVDIPEEKREGLVLIGHDEVETLEYHAPELRVRLTKYAKYAHPQNKDAGVVSPERPTGLTAGDRFDVSVGVEVVAWKYFYHLPFYRQQDMFAGGGWTPSRSTLANLETAVEFTLRPLAEHLRGVLQSDTCVGCDDTSVVLITPKVLPDLSDHPRAGRIAEVLGEAIAAGKPSIKASMWGYYASRLPVVAFDFTVGRHRDGPDGVLSDYEGHLIGDCWSGFRKIDVRSDCRITFAACWAHARRKIDECRGSFPLQVAKLESMIRTLYDIEDQIRGFGDAEKLDRRRSLSRGVLDRIERYLDSESMSSPSVLPRSNLGMAAAYVRRHWEALTRFVDQPGVPIDNNDCEQLMKRIATGRKNWLFKGSLAAGERSATLMTVIGSAIRNDLDVRAYLDDVLRRTLAGETDWSKLTPHAWRSEHPEAIRDYRQDERRQAADRKKTTRARRRLAQQIK